MKIDIQQNDITISFDLDFDHSKFAVLIDKIIEFKMAKFQNSIEIQQLLDKIHEDILDRDINIDLEEVDFFIRDDNEPYTDEEQAEFMNDYMIARGF